LLVLALLGVSGRGVRLVESITRFKKPSPGLRPRIFPSEAHFRTLVFNLGQNPKQHFAPLMLSAIPRFRLIFGQKRGVLADFLLLFSLSAVLEKQALLERVVFF
jgi:hypothetical protein